MDTITHNELRDFTIFDGVEEHIVQAVNRAVSVQDYKKNQPIELPGPTSPVLHFVKSGHVKISRVTVEGKEMIVDIVGSGELLGELSLGEDFDDITEIAQALNEVSIYSIRRSQFDILLDKHPQLSVYATRRLGLRLRKIEERMKDMLFKDVRRRIASFLVRHSEEFGRIKQHSVFIKPYLSHQDIALLTGSTRQTVTSTLNEFRTMGIIDFSRKGFTIIEYDRLKQLAK
jgi:CRP/FNR family transcriptional regulator, cyclic AMP receptor protein